MTKQEQIKKMINTCNNHYSCALCPYNPEDISRFIGDKWIGGCPNYDRKLVYAMSKGYRKIDDDYFDVITKAELKQYKVQAVKEFAEKLKEYPLESKNLVWEYGVGWLDCYQTIKKAIDELLKEYER